MGKRQGFSAKLVVGKDDDLIGKLNSIPAGHRSNEAKDAMRKGFGMPAHGTAFEVPTQLRLPLDQIGSSVNWLQDAMLGMERYLEDKFASFERLVQQGGSVAPPPEPERQKASKLQMEQRDAKLAKAEW